MVLLEMVEEPVSESVAADSGDEVDGIAENASVVGKVCWRATELVAVGQKVPEYLTNGDDAGGCAHVALVFFLGATFQRRLGLRLNGRNAFFGGINLGCIR